MTITVAIKTVYGVDKVYPICEKAQLFARIAGTRILTDETVYCIKQLGYTLEVEQGAATL